MGSETRCPGCGARNAPDARSCDWCGRPFLLRDQRRQARAIWTLGTVACVLLALVALVVAAVNAWGLPVRPGREPALVASPPPAPSPELAPTGEEPALEQPSPEPAAETPEFVRVANTAGQGVVLRREPSTSAPRVVVRAENAELRIIGPDSAVEGRVWRRVQDAQGNQGWVPAEFLVPVPR